jgi:hypothetical protein
LSPLGAGKSRIRIKSGLVIEIPKLKLPTEVGL